MFQWEERRNEFIFKYESEHLEWDKLKIKDEYLKCDGKIIVLGKYRTTAELPTNVQYKYCC